MNDSTIELPEVIQDEEQLDELLSRPTDKAIEILAEHPGDILLLGVAGKMGPTLARMARRAADAAGSERRVIGVSRFSSPGVADWLNRHGVETIAGDLLDDAFLASLPDAPNVIFMSGMKFGSTGQEAQTWAMNCYLPALVGKRFRNSRLVTFSTGNIYGLTPADGPGSIESDPLNPVGEYAMSCVGRERMFQYMAERYQVPTAILRLNYAHELRYGLLVDLADKIVAGEPVPQRMAYANVIWQGDANAMTLCALRHASPEAFIVNLAGPERLHVPAVCQQLAAELARPVTFSGDPAPDALLSNGALGHQLYGLPRVPLERLLHWVADWIAHDGARLGKPTHFEVRDGKF